MVQRRDDDWDPDLDAGDEDVPSDEERDRCVPCGRVVPGLYAVANDMVSADEGPVCQGPGPFPRPCSAGLRMPSGAVLDEPMAVATRPRDWAEPARPILFDRRRDVS
ncbi:MAG TPA: hypothetical protein VN597_14035 [Streptosporangiaceae bacterium]|nr:hypothetical protein [Streptosporangiaceae bacterium]